MQKARDTIEFILGNTLQNISFSDFSGICPTTTLLKYLRGNASLKGTKEGCGEGDCGACTVVMVELVEGRLIYKTVNSCLIFLPQIHGKQIITVEHLQLGSQLHPVQQAMVDMDASQCGFCTPGFVMSLFALYKTNHLADDKDILDAFAGNLCRCTGYDSILKAARFALKNILPDQFDQYEKVTIQKLKNISIVDGSFITQKQTYLQPATVKTALELKNDNPKSAIISGSTDVALRVTKKNELLPLIIDLSLLKELKTIENNTDNVIVGSEVSLQQIKECVGDEIPVFNKILSVFGSKQIRHKATLGGNIASASPICDIAPLFFALKAKLNLISVDGQRVMPVDQFILGYHKTALKPNELIKEFIIPKNNSEYHIDIEKLSKRVDLDISNVSVALRLKLDEKKCVEEIYLVYGGMAEVTKRATNTENALMYKKWEHQSIELAAIELEKDFAPISDARATADGRMLMARNLLMKLWLNYKLTLN